MTTPEIYIASATITADQAGALETAVEIICDQSGQTPPVLTYYEIDGGAAWQIDIYFEQQVDERLLAAMKRQAQCDDLVFTFKEVADKDWVVESQKGLPPIHVGRFFIHGSHDTDKIPETVIPILLDASQAFGTGHHETTFCCLELLNDLVTDLSPRTIIDVGTGTGLLALAAQKLWPEAKIVASDIDPIAIEVVKRTLADNQTPINAADEQGITTVVADGMADLIVQDNAPYDLIIANILAAPLIDMAPALTDCLKKGGRLILSGLLATQQKEVLAAYSAQGQEEISRKQKGDWLALLLGN